MRIAIAHDSIIQFGGAERVLHALHEIYPDAPVFTLVFDNRLKSEYEGWNIISSPLQYLYNIFPRFQWMLPLIPFAMRFFNFSKFDVVLSSSSIFMKGLPIPRGVVHINYCHTPARFLWLEKEEYIQAEVPAVLRPFASWYLERLRKWDFRAAQKVTYFLTNSKNVQTRIKKVYGRDSTVVYPFVDTEFFYPTKPKENYYLVAGRLQAHKRVDVVVDVFNKNGKELHIVGTGRAEQQLQAKAGHNIQFLGKVEDEILRNEYSGALAFIFPQEEDFGIMPLEAMASGTPVIAYGRGGALETVVAGKTGLFFEQQTPEALEKVIQKFEASKFASEDFFDQAQKFSKQQFVDGIRNFVETHSKAVV